MFHCNIRVLCKNKIAEATRDIITRSSLKGDPVKQAFCFLAVAVHSLSAFFSFRTDP